MCVCVCVCVCVWYLLAFMVCVCVCVCVCEDAFVDACVHIARILLYVKRFCVWSFGVELP